MSEQGNSFQIGTSVETMQDVRVLCGRNPDESSFQEFTEVVGADGAGQPIEAGLPIAAWKWGLLTQAHFDELRNLASGASASVYIRTRTNEGAPHYRYKTFAATVKRPKAGSQPGELRKAVVLEFVNLVEQ